MNVLRKWQFDQERDARTACARMDGITCIALGSAVVVQARTPRDLYHATNLMSELGSYSTEPSPYDKWIISQVA